MASDKIDILKMQTARALMDEGHKEAARSVLETCAHPKAPEWLAKLPQQKMPCSPSKTSPILLGSIVIIVLVVALLSFMAGRMSAPPASLAEVLSSSPAPGTQAFVATLATTHEALQDANEQIYTWMTLTAASAPATMTPFGGG